MSLFKNISNQGASVTFDEVTKVYSGSVPAVNKLSFTIKQGTLVTLLGPSGCGKTTTLRLIAGLEMPSHGRIFLGPEDITKSPASARDISMVFQSYALFPHMRVWENVAYGPRVKGMAKAPAYDLALDGLDLVGLKTFAQRFPNELSGGQQQRVAVARSLALKPQVLLFDEPLSNLDTKLRRRMREDIRDIQRNLGLTAVYVTHDQEEALAVSDNIIVMDNARIAQMGSPKDIYETPATLFVADFIGDANVLDAEILSIRHSIASVAIDVLILDLPHRNNKLGKVQVAIRPESILLQPRKTKGPKPKKSWLGKISKATYVGSSMEYAVQTKFAQFFVVTPSLAKPFAEGQAVSITLATHGVTLLGS